MLLLELMNISSNQFFYHYIFDPLSDDLEFADKVICTITTIAIAILTLGTVHAALSISNFINRRFNLLNQKIENPQAVDSCVLDDRNFLHLVALNGGVGDVSGLSKF